MSSSEGLVAYMADCRALVLEEMRRLVPRDGPFRKVLYDLVFEYPLRDAKALRPSLCIATCRALGGSLEGVATSATVLELYHNAFLVHDDVEDGSLRRRDGPTLHEAHGVPVAVNVGDAMLALALEPLLENMRLLSLGKALRILQVVANMARESAEGQALELAWIRSGSFALRDREYLRMVHKKTTHYTFLTPMVVGAIAAGAEEEQIAALRRFATALGSAFQIRDDILNLTGTESVIGKEPCGDLWEGKHTLVLLHAVRSASPRDRARALAALRKPRPPSSAARESEALESVVRRLHGAGEITAGARSVLLRRIASERRVRAHKTERDVAFLRRLVDRHHSIDYAKRTARRRALRARTTLESMSRWLPGSVHRDFLYGLSDFIIERER